MGVVVFKDADGCKLAQEQLHGIDAFMAGTVECTVGTVQKKKKAPPKTPNPSLAARNAERFAAPPRPQDPRRPHPYPLRTARTSWARACNSAPLPRSRSLTRV